MSRITNPRFMALKAILSMVVISLLRGKKRRKLLLDRKTWVGGWILISPRKKPSRGRKDYPDKKPAGHIGFRVWLRAKNNPLQ